ncbi:TetR/AcrR family transcriptional regulator [Actinophytocola oryzae]|uniref:TetR family transcriptional regulator n=1 Tax=Actinophytocola oryzae TaxID=502181 RepID=A0A4V3FRT8_9PSEU|nr:TetR/AcrR family transcriptional regulator [Actinophytocola oryzae]TDV44891.1 TetR family transcriptional regulator [Actinophytocola oryzae]
MDRTGRPRDPHIDNAVLEATSDVLSLVGYARLTMEEVARRAGTTKPAVYRRWPNRQFLVLDALVRRLGLSVTRVPDSGCVVCDLVDAVGVFQTAYGQMPPGVLAALLADCTGQPGLRSRFMTKLFHPPRDTVGRVIDRAKARGDLRADLDVELAVDLLGSLVYCRALFGHGPAQGETLVATLLRGMAANTRESTGDHQHALD